MDFKQEVEQHLQAFLNERPDLFLIALKFSAADDITVVLDGDNGVTLQDCLDASRAVEFNLDREAHDFSLQVMSYGATEPLELPRQFKKNIGRTLDILHQDDTNTEGELLDSNEEGATVLLKYRKPKEVGKGKVDVEEEKFIPYSDIKKAVVTIKF